MFRNKPIPVKIPEKKTIDQWDENQQIEFAFNYFSQVIRQLGSLPIEEVLKGDRDE